MAILVLVEMRLFVWSRRRGGGVGWGDGMDRDLTLLPLSMA